MHAPDPEDRFCTCNSAEGIAAQNPNDNYDTGIPEELAPLEGRPPLLGTRKRRRHGELGYPGELMIKFLHLFFPSRASRRRPVALFVASTTRRQLDC